MQLLFVIFLLEPFRTIELPVRCQKLEYYEGMFYLIQKNNRGIVRVDTLNNVQNISIEGNVNNCIYGFNLTPFYIYLNMMGGIFKLAINTGLIENIYKGDVVSFVLTDAEEIVLADRLEKEVLFLDRQYQIRLMKKNLNIVDMDYFDHRVYLLTRKEIIVFDEYGNVVQKIKILPGSERILVAEKIYLFTPGQKTVLVKEGKWQRIELSSPFIDLNKNENFIFTLSQYGDSIYIYNKSDF